MQLGRAHILVGNRGKAGYDDLLALRKGAGHDIPILKQDQSRMRKAAIAVPAINFLRMFRLSECPKPQSTSM